MAGNGRFTQTLLVFQFVICFLNTILGFVIYKNNLYQQNRDWGYQKSQVLAVNISNESEFTQLKNKLAQHPDIKNVAGAKSHIARSRYIEGITILDKVHHVVQFEVGYDYVETMGLRLQGGRIFDRDNRTDLSSAILVNETFVKAMGWADPIGQHIKQNNLEYQVIGVLEDFHYFVFTRKIEPTILKLTDEADYQYLAIATQEGKATQVSEYVKETWRELFPNRPYNSFFQDRVFEQYMNTMVGVSKINSASAAIAIFMTCMGIFGLVTLVVNNKMKELSIRKVLGASITNITRVVSTRYLTLFVLGAIIALPASYIYSRMLLESIWHYHYDIGVAPFIWGFLVVMAATALTISSQIYKAASTNPVEILRNE